MTSAAQGEDLQLHALIERSRLIGADESLVVLGGGNTSAKGEVVDQLGRQQSVLWVKGSGAQLRTAGASDFPALRMNDLLPLREFTELTDDAMLDLVTQAMLDPTMRRPSIETLLHAFLPFAHIDHVHADAICTLTNHDEGRRLVREALGDEYAYLDWMRPGFTLSRLVAELAQYQGVVLAHHGLVTWGPDSATCWQRTQETVQRARAFIDAYEIRTPIAPSDRIEDLDPETTRSTLLKLRGAMATTGRRVLRIERGERALADHPQLAKIVAGGVSSADHMLTIKPRSAILADADDGQEIAQVIAEYADAYRHYVDRAGGGDVPLLHDPMPKVVLVPGLGMVTSGRTTREALEVARVASHTHQVARDIVERFGLPVPLTEAEEFAFDYWPLEVYKLTLRKPAGPLAGFVAVVTGAASGIGRGIAEYLAAAGASLVLADLSNERLAEVAAAITTAGGSEPELVVGDQSDPGVVEMTIDRAVDAFGGVDGVVVNAGIAAAGRLTDLTLDEWERAQRVNLTSAFLITQQALRRMHQQGCGGSIVYIASKNAFGPGAGFGAYSVSKAGMIQLMRIAALEGGADGVRANAVNPDAVFDNSRLWEGGIREERAAAHGIAPEELQEFYAARNLLHRQVSTADVAAAVAFLLSDASSRTTGAVLPVDGGVAAAFPR